MKNTDASANAALDKNATKMLHRIMVAGKVETPKPVEKSRFRPVLARTQGRTAMPGEARELANSEGFQRRCGHAGIPATRRQAAKYIQKRGRLWRYEHSTIGRP